MIMIFLDDERIPQDVTWESYPDAYNVIVLRTFNDFTNYITKLGVPDFVSFDHDLADYDEHGHERTGYDCARWLVDYCVVSESKFPYFVVHSQNPIGKQNIERYIHNAKRHLNI